jgi:hypothetical protein
VPEGAAELYQRGAELRDDLLELVNDARRELQPELADVAKRAYLEFEHVAFTDHEAWAVPSEDRAPEDDEEE